MFRKSVFIMLFVCLLAPVAMAAYPWDNQLEWKSSASPKDANWYNAANWSNEGTLPCPTDGSGPGPTFYCAVLPNQPGPRITGNATCSMLSLNPWDPTSWQGQDCNVSVMDTALDVNLGSAIQINSQTDYDSYLGTSVLSSRAIVNVYGGTVHTDLNGGSSNLSGVTVGGGSSSFGMAYGMLNIYGGEVNVPRAVLNFGEIGLYGGTLQICTDSNFTVNTTHPGAALNKIKIDGGTFIVAGNHAPDINTYRAGGFIICERGTLRDPVYDGTWTTLIADINYCVWNPTPANGATNVHYKYNSSDPNDPCSITLSWNESSVVGNIDTNDDIYFGTSFADVNTAIKGSPQYMGSRNDDNNDPCSFTIKDPNKFALNTTYYWRVDENSVSNGFKKGLVWSFTTHDGKAYNPKPADDANSKPLKEPLQLSWSSGDWAAIHRVFFGTNIGEVGAGTITKTTGVYRGTTSDPVYPLSRLAETAVPAYRAWTLTVGQTYYWRIDEVNGATVWGGPSGGAGQVPSPSPTWSFTPAAYINIDDFEDSMSTDDVNANWLFGYTITHTGASTGCNNATAKGYAGRLLTRDSSGKFLQYTFNNDGANPAFSGASFSEAKRAYSIATSFTGGTVFSPAVKALRIDYRGSATNAANNFSGSCPAPLGGGDLDRMYVAIEDSAGDVAIYLNPDSNAQLVGNWTSWYTALKDLNDIAHGQAPDGSAHVVSLEAITGFSIGFGIRGDTSDSDFADQNSVVMFDNIRLYAATCVPQYGPTADLDGDCDVDINDLDRLAADWLTQAYTLTFPGSTPPHKAPILWYKFNNNCPGGGCDQNNLVADYGTGDANNYTGTINAFIATNWKAGKGRHGDTCLYLPPSGGCYVLAPVAASPGFNALGFMGDAAHSTAGGGGISFSVWINADETSGNMQSSWNGLFGVWDPCVAIETLEVHCPSPLPPTDGIGPRCNFIKRSPSATASAFNMHVGDFGGKWNHWAMTKDDYSLRVYHNGVLMGHYDANNLPGDPNINAYGRLFVMPAGSFRIGTRGGNWGMWNGYIQDFQTYDYCLSDGEVANLALDGGSSIFVPLVSPANLKTGADPNTEIVNFGDLAIMGQQWHTMILWP
jgi:hypothetical protein